MANGWFVVKVDLESGMGLEFDPPPGRLMLVGPDHTLTDLAVAIDLALARWDPSHLHEFRFQDGRRFGPVGPEFDGLDGQDRRGDSVGKGGAGDLDDGLIDYKTVTAASVIRQGEPFEYVFDRRANWRHQCVALGGRVDPMELAGIVPRPPVAVWGWGQIPDQYGRTRADEDLGVETQERGAVTAGGPAKRRGSSSKANRRVDPRAK